MLVCREYDYWSDYDFLLGIDEAGRGPWAGPLVAAAVIFPKDFKNIPKDFIELLNDSKQLTEKQRNSLFKKIKKYCLAYSVSYYHNDFIDKQGIGNANQLIVQKLYLNIKRKMNKIDLVLLDYIGGFKNNNFDYKMFAKGDSQFLSIAAASVLAKVSRDRWMKKYDKKYPQYGFAQHKGYGTKKHRQFLEKFGPCSIHRLSFSPMKEMVQREEQISLFDQGNKKL